MKKENTHQENEGGEQMTDSRTHSEGEERGSEAVRKVGSEPVI